MPANHRPADLRAPISPFMALVEEQRRITGMTRAELCRRVTIARADGSERPLSPAAYSRYMNDGGEPSVSIWMKLAEAVGCRVRVERGAAVTQPRRSRRRRWWREAHDRAQAPA
jgi:hypothetical protein